jgi:hypothetical protein
MLTGNLECAVPSINLTTNTSINLAASSADDNATLNRYLKSLLTFKTPPSFDAISGLLVKDQKESGFPIVLSATGDGKFAVERSSLDVQLGASASLGLLQGSDQSDFLSALIIDGQPSSSGLVSFALQGTLTAGDEATVGDTTLGIADEATVTLTSYYAAAASDTLGAAATKAVAALTIPNDVEDLHSLPPGAICQVDAASSLKFTASATYSFLNDPLAAASLGSLPAFAIDATAGATLEGTATHTADHTLTIARLPNGLLHLSVSLTRTDDFETSLTVSAGVAANIGSQDALAFLLDKINPNSAAESDAIASQMSDAAQYRADIKSAIDAALTKSFGVSLQAALETSKARNRVFVFEIDLDALDEASEQALQAALKGDFTAITQPSAKFKGIAPRDSALTVTATATHTLALHFLGIFNAASVNQFIVNSTIDFTKDTHEIVLSDETLQVVDTNLDANKLRKLVLKDITLTLPASANTKDVDTPITLAFIDREGTTRPSRMRQFVNVMSHVGSPSAAAAQALLDKNLKNYGACGLSLSVALKPAQCRQLFIAADGKPQAFAFYIAAISNAEKTILAGDADNAFRLRLFNAGATTWADLQEAGSAPNIGRILQSLGLSATEAQIATTDAMTAVWWAEAMAKYAKALANNQSLVAVGKDVVKDSNEGYNEPWMILAAWDLTGRPEIGLQFTTSLPALVVAAR